MLTVKQQFSFSWYIATFQFDFFFLFYKFLLLLLNLLCQRPALKKRKKRKKKTIYHGLGIHNLSFYLMCRVPDDALNLYISSNYS